jgi:hypothetical protein
VSSTRRADAADVARLADVLLSYDELGTGAADFDADDEHDEETDAVGALDDDAEHGGDDADDADADEAFLATDDEFGGADGDDHEDGEFDHGDDDAGDAEVDADAESARGSSAVYDADDASEIVSAADMLLARKSLREELAEQRRAMHGRHNSRERRRIDAHNRRVAARNKREAKRQQRYLSDMAKAHGAWQRFNRRQKKEYAKAPRAIVFNHRVKAVVDRMVNRRFKQYAAFFVRHYLNHSPYVDISRGVKKREEQNPNPRKFTGRKWFDPLPQGFKGKSGAKKGPAEYLIY